LRTHIEPFDIHAGVGLLEAAGKIFEELFAVRRIDDDLLLLLSASSEQHDEYHPQRAENWKKAMIEK
jgi:hypothetical protein